LAISVRKKKVPEFQVDYFATVPRRAMNGWRNPIASLGKGYAVAGLST
jgi:hypothetical protein